MGVAPEPCFYLPKIKTMDRGIRDMSLFLGPGLFLNFRADAIINNVPRYRVIDHTADLGAYFYGADPKAVFENAGQALFDLMVDRLPRRGEEEVRVSVEGTDREDLLVRWLNEMLYLFQVKERVVASVEISGLSENGLSARVSLARFDLGRHGLKNEIKAATYHGLELRPWRKGWRARVIFDL